MAALPPLLSPCIDDVVAHAGTLIDHAVDEALDAIEAELMQLTSQALRRQQAAAQREMAMLRGNWRLTFPNALRDAVRNPPPPKPQGAMVRASSLTLVDDDEVTQNIESSRLAQHLRSAAEQPLAELDALMSSALGLDVIQPEANPLRPDVISAALRKALAATADDPAYPGIWMRHLAKPLGKALPDLYKQCSKQLRQARVEAAGYRVVTSPAPLTSTSASLPADTAERTPSREGAPSQPGSIWRNMTGIAEQISQALRGPMFSEFLTRGSAQAMQALAPGWFARVDQELADLEARRDEPPPNPRVVHQYAHLPAVERPVREVGTESPLDREVWGTLSAPRQRSLVRTRLKQQAQNVGQAMGLEVVRQMVDQVARDPRLLAPVREAIVALEPSLARLALKSPRFFGEAEHPARNLVARVAERSLRYNDEFAHPFVEFFKVVSRRFKALNAYEALKDEAPFRQALADLEAEWTREDEGEEARRQQLLEAMQFAESRQAEADQIAWGLGQRSDLDGVPAEVQDFLYGRWALVMAHARLKSHSREIDPGGYGAVVTDLLWTVKQETVLRDPAHAFVLIPKVVSRLRAGLDLLGDIPSADDTFFRALEKLHRPVLKLRARHRKQAFDVPSELPMDAVEAAPSAPREKSGEVWLAPREQRNFGYQDTVLHKAAQEEAKASAVPAPRADALIAQLAVGAWVDLYSRQEWLRAQLTWASGNGALFMFVSHGGLAHSMTRRSLQRLVSDRLLRVVEGHEVVQHAIEQIGRAQREKLAA